MPTDPKRDELPDVDDAAQRVIDRYLNGDIEPRRKGGRRARVGAKEQKAPPPPAGPAPGASWRSMHEPLPDLPPVHGTKRSLDLRCLLALPEEGTMRAHDVAFECAKPTHEILPVLDDLLTRGLVEPVGSSDWALTSEGRRARQPGDQTT